MSLNDLHPADLAGFEAIVQVMPVLRDLIPATEAFDFPPCTVLHAGPPFTALDAVPKAVLNSTAAAAVFEGWASDREEAMQRILLREIKLAAAQDFRCAVPLASVLSPSQVVQVVEDANQRDRRAFSSLNGGNGPALRLGLPIPSVIDHLRWLNGELADAMRAACRIGTELLPIADAALTRGDDLHGRTQAATQQLAESFGANQAFPSVARHYLAASPSFFLNLWMAATKCMLSGAEGIEGCSMVTSLGANGVDVGIQLAARPGHWFTRPSSPPRGNLDSGILPEERLPAIGDSALIEASGLGAMAFAHSPVQRENLGQFLSRSPEELALELLMAPHPALGCSKARFGLNARQATYSRQDLAVALGIIDIEGRRGRIGGGIWHSTPELFQLPLESLSSPIFPL